MLLVEDDRLTAALLKDVLLGHGFEVSVAGSASAARQELDEFDPDVALLDIMLGDGPSGVALAHLITRAYPCTSVMFLTRFADAHAAGLVAEDLPDGCGFLRKDRINDADYLLGAIEATLRNAAADYRQDVETDRPLAVLTRTQREILRMVAQGLTNTAIAERRGTSASAVEQALSGIFRALGIGHSPDRNPRVQAALTYIAAVGIPDDP